MLQQRYSVRYHPSSHTHTHTQLRGPGLPDALLLAVSSPVNARYHTKHRWPHESTLRGPAEASGVIIIIFF